MRGVAALVAVLCLGGIAYAAPEAAHEYDIKGAMLLKLTAFITWPNESEGAGEGDVEPAAEKQKRGRQNVRIGILGTDPFGPGIDQLATRASTAEHTLQISRPALESVAESCEAVFISRSEEANLAAILTKLGGHPVLTISDIPSFAEKGGMIELEMQDRRVSLRINQKTVQDAGLTASSKLLQLARVVLFDQDEQRK
jgi:hypothetical protein